MVDIEVIETLRGKDGDTVLIHAGMERSTCKIGQGADCCIFLVGGANGFECAKFSSLAKPLLARKYLGTMVANRVGSCRLLPEDCTVEELGG